LTRQSFNFDDAVRLAAPGGGFSAVQDIDLALPETFGWGVANDRLLNGRLLVAGDILFKRYSDADFFRAIWEDQFVFMVGAQYQASRRIRLRMGYAYAENITRDLTPLAAGGVVPPDGLPGVKYVQAQFPAINQHRLAGGVGVRDVLPGVDLDLFAGGMFEAEERLAQTSVSVEAYWVGMGLTWRFGRGACERLPIPDRW
jgi:long-chain fatty acid transport protein